MEKNTYHDPISGDTLEVLKDGLLYNENNDSFFTVDNSGKIIDLKSPTNGGKLHLDTDGLFASDYDSTKYAVNNGHIIPLLSPLNNSELTKDADGLYSSRYDSVKYMVSAKGIIKPLIDPYNYGTLTSNPDGTYQSQTTGKPFIYDQNRNALIPLYVPDDSGELAHIEGDMLVSNETGRKFEIDAGGTILTPQEIEFRRLKQQENERFDQMNQDGTIVDYLNNVKKKIQSQQALSIDKLREIVNNDLPDQLSDIKPQAESVTPTQLIMTRQEFLKSNNITDEASFVKYLINMGLDEQIPTLMARPNGTNFMSLLGENEDDSIAVITKKDGNKAWYMPTTKTSQNATSIELLQDGSITIINNHPTPIMVNGIRYGNVSIVDINMMENGDLNLVESYHEVMPTTGLEEVECSPRFTVTSSQTPITINPNGETKQGINMNMQTILYSDIDGVLKPIQEDRYMEEKLQQLRALGFDEKYFTKPSICGINYDINGNETMVESENLHQIPELGFNELQIRRPIDPYGDDKANTTRLL